MHYSMFCKFQKEKVHFKYPDEAWKHEVWNDGHFMHSTAAALITSRKGEGLSDSEY